jgi:hypothetical protein
MVITITYDHQARRRSYELLADAFGLSAHMTDHVEMANDAG